VHLFYQWTLVVLIYQGRTTFFPTAIISVVSSTTRLSCLHTEFHRLLLLWAAVPLVVLMSLQWLMRASLLSRREPFFLVVHHLYVYS